MYKRADVKWREENSGIIIYCPKRARLFHLNSTAAEVWKVIDNNSLHDITKKVADIYAIAATEIKGDIAECIDDLLNKGLVNEDNR